MNISLQKLMVPVALVLLFGTTSLEARSFRVNQLPNGSSVGCGGCHVSPSGGGARNAFGSEVESSFLDGGNVNWVTNLALVDSDGDGFTNGHELEDPFGLWSSGDDNPGNSAFVTNPGSNSDVPSGEAAKFSLHMNITGMSPHTGQYFEISVVDVATDSVVANEEIASIVDPDFEYVFMHALDAGASYNIDMWADLNTNGSYDAPPTDHSWRIELNNVSDNTAQNFQHNTDFTDLGGTVSIDSETFQPQDFVLYENYPNPFNPETSIRFELASAGHVNLDIFNIRGEQVAQLISSELNAGAHQVQWSAKDLAGNDLPTGIYIYTLRRGAQSQSKRMMLLK